MMLKHQNPTTTIARRPRVEKRYVRVKAAGKDSRLIIHCQWAMQE
jgi:hypothetical protein